MRLLVLSASWLFYYLCNLFISLQISGQLKSLQLVAALTSERDGEIRKAALNTMATAYKNLGEFVDYKNGAIVE